jgi:hypothetical protein
MNDNYLKNEYIDNELDNVTIDAFYSKFKHFKNIKNSKNNLTVLISFCFFFIT